MGLSVNALKTTVANAAKPGDGAPLDWLRSKSGHHALEADDLAALANLVRQHIGKRLQELVDAYADLRVTDWLFLEPVVLKVENSKTTDPYTLQCQGRAEKGENGLTLHLVLSGAGRGLVEATASRLTYSFSVHGLRAAQALFRDLETAPEFQELPGLMIRATPHGKTDDEVHRKSSISLDIEVTLPLGAEPKTSADSD